MHWQWRQRRYVSIGLAITVWAAIGLVLPLAMNFDGVDMVSQTAVVAASRDTYVIDGPVVMLRTPGVRMERGIIAGGHARAAGAARSDVRYRSLMLENAVISIDSTLPGDNLEQPGAGDDVAERAVAPLVMALAGGAYDTLTLKKATIRARLAGASIEPLTDVSAIVQLKSRSSIIVKGSGRIRGRKLDFEATIGGAPAAPGGTGGQFLPIRLAIRSGLAQGQIDGRLEFGKALELRGNGQLAIGSGRELARWFGAYWLSGPGLRDIKAKGQVALANGSLGFEQAGFEMDGNHATGALAFSFARKRPELTGTLAVKTLDATRYLGSARGAGARAGELLSWAALSAGALTVPLGMHLDADVRISADTFKCGNVELKGIAAAVALKDGRLLADFPELTFGGGTGGGQIAADFTGFVPQVTVRGKLKDVDLGQATRLVAGTPLVTAAGTVVADVTSKGFTLRDLIGGLTGKISVESGAGGKLGIDLARLSGGDGAGFRVQALKGSTAFDKLNLKLILRDGVVMTEQAEARAGTGGWSATGSFNLSSSRVDVRLTQSAGPARGNGAKDVLPKVLEVHGPWDQPRIKALSDGEVAGDAVASSADGAAGARP